MTPVTATQRKGTTLILHRIPVPGAWAEQAACRGWPVDWWFPTRGKFASQVTAANLCSGCPVRVECAAYALSHVQLLGTWGGLSEKQRRRARSERRAS